MNSDDTVLGSYLDFAKSSVAPRYFTVGPPNYYSQTSFPKKLDISANIMVDDSLIGGELSLYEKVSTRRGLIMWSVNRGAYSCYRFSIVQAGAITDMEANDLVQGLAPLSNVLSTGRRLTYTNEVAIPYGTSDKSGDTVSISPDIVGTFSQVRVCSGDLRVISDSLPIGNTALNGYLSAGSFTDVRDVSQAGPRNTGKLAFSPADLVQSSTTAKDGIKEVGGAKGIVSVVGSDIQPFFDAPDFDKTAFYEGKMGQYTLADVDIGAKLLGGDFTLPNGPGLSPIGLGMIPAVTDPTTGPNDGKWFCLQAFLSPWGVELSSTTTTGSGFVAGNKIVNINTGPINPNGGLEITLRAGGLANMYVGGNWPPGATFAGNASNETVAAPPPGIEINQQYVVTFIHIFGTVVGSPEYGVAYHSLTEERYYHVGAQCYDVVAMCETSNSMLARDLDSFTINNKNLRFNMTKGGGMYIGTLVTVRGQNISVHDSVVPGVGNLIMARLQWREVGLYKAGELGPVRVIRWDGMSDGQQIKVDGTVFCQCIPQGRLAPFVRSDAQYSNTTFDLNAISWLAELYNGNSPFRRNWTGDDYDMFMRREYPALTWETVSAYKNIKLRALGHTAGEMSTTVGGVSPLTIMPAGASASMPMGEQLVHGARALTAMGNTMRGGRRRRSSSANSETSFMSAASGRRRKRY